MPLINTTSITILSAVISLLTGASVLFHDSEFDRATLRAIDNPKVAVLQQLSEPYRSNEHSHEESSAEALNSATSIQPSLQTRLAEGKRYLNPKKIYVNTTTYDGTKY